VTGTTTTKVIMKVAIDTKRDLRVVLALRDLRILADLAAQGKMILCLHKVSEFCHRVKSELPPVPRQPQE